MRFFHLAKVVSASAGLWLCLTGVVPGQAVNGNRTINAPGNVLGKPLSVSTSSQFAGAVSSIKWGDKEYINNWDHGRQLQLNSQFFNRYICYNPYEAGGFDDGSSPTSTSKLLSMTASGNRLEAITQMAWYYRFRESLRPEDYCGDPARWLPCPAYTGPLSDYKVHKTVTIGFANIPNVIEYLVDQLVPEPILKGLDNVTAVVNYDFSSIRSWDVVSKDYRSLRALSGQDDRIKVVSTPDGNYAMGWYAPELLQPYDEIGAVNWWFIVPPEPAYPDPNFACVHFGTINSYESLNGSSSNPAHSFDRAYVVIGNLEQVRQTLAQVHSQFAPLDPEVFSWRDYLAINGLGSITTPEAAQSHWINNGIAEGRRGSKTFSPARYLQLNPDLANFFGATNYPAAIGHYVSAGRAEGRSTVAKPAVGMQHLLVLANGRATAAGQNSYGQAGNGETSRSLGPTAVGLSPGATEVASGDYTSLAVHNDGSVWVWGSNQYGARGDGSNGGNLVTPVQVPIPARISTPQRNGKHAIAVGTGSFAAIDTQGQVWTWGVNWNGRLGDGTASPRFTPARVKKSANPNDFLTGIVSISAGGGTMAAVDADGAVWTWGAGASGNLGNGFTDDSVYPVQVVQRGNNNSSTPLAGITQVACGSSGFCIALARYGQVFGWGNNDFSQMGIAPGGGSSIAIPISVGPGGIDSIATGSAHCIARSAVDGKVYGWGYNGYGQLGNGSAGVAQYPPVPMASGPNDMKDISDLAACGNFSAMVRYTDRAVFVAGDNQSGQVGIPGSPLTHYLPVKSALVP